MILAGRCGGHRSRARPFLAIGREQLLPPSAAKQKLPKEVPCFPVREKEPGGREPCGGAEGPFPAAARTRPALPAPLPARQGSHADPETAGSAVPWLFPAPRARRGARGTEPCTHNRHWAAEASHRPLHHTGAQPAPSGTKAALSPLHGSSGHV